MFSFRFFVLRIHLQLIFWSNFWQPGIFDNTNPTKWPARDHAKTLPLKGDISCGLGGRLRSINGALVEKPPGVVKKAGRRKASLDFWSVFKKSYWVSWNWMVQMSFQHPLKANHIEWDLSHQLDDVYLVSRECRCQVMEGIPAMYHPKDRYFLWGLCCIQT